MGAKRAFLPLVLAFLSTVAFGCLNDRDTAAYLPLPLSDEQTEILKTTVGWFPVHSDAYYRARIDGAEAELKLSPGRFDLYDDVAVAYDRLGHDDQAIEVIERKRKALLAAGVTAKVQPRLTNATLDQISRSSLDPWYRYYANSGTFWAHRWLKEGKRAPGKKSWIDRAQHDIDEAIRLNPQAHGLREFAQAEAIRWIRTQPDVTLYEFLPESFWQKPEAALALAGLVSLGGAWESPDVFQALGLHYAGSGYERLAFHLSERVLELEANGRKSLTGESLEFDPTHPRPLPVRTYHSVPHSVGLKSNKQRDKYTYHRYRLAAEAMRTGLKAYEDVRIAKGDFPDNDPAFYRDYKVPEFPDYWNEERESYRKGQVFWGLATLVIGILGLRMWKRAGTSRLSGSRYAGSAECLAAIVVSMSLAAYVGYALPLEARILFMFVFAVGTGAFVGRSCSGLLSWLVAMFAAGFAGGFGALFFYNLLVVIAAVAGSVWGASMRKAMSSFGEG